MTKRVALLFAGQGSQMVGMGRDLYNNFNLAQDFFDAADDQLGFNLSETMFDGPESDLMRTGVCQPALFLHGYVGFKLLKDAIPDLDVAYAAGLSLGEFTAHASAGSFSFEVGLDLVAKRGRYMEQAADEHEGAMAVMNGAEQAAVVDLAEQCGVAVANFNTPVQFVISGSKTGVEKAVETARQTNLCATQVLQVSGAFHSQLMRSAQERLAGELQGLSVESPMFPVVSNVLAEPAEGEVIKELLRRQVVEPVQWRRSMDWLVEQGDFHFIQIGVGKSIAGLMRRNHRGVKVAVVEDAASLAKAIEACH